MNSKTPFAGIGNVKPEVESSRWTIVPSSLKQYPMRLPVTKEALNIDIVVSKLGTLKRMTLDEFKYPPVVSIW